jgi:lambda family phage minor tail protein L
MGINADIQTLEPGERVELFELDATLIGAEVYRFHGYKQIGPIWWQGLEYSPWPIQASGFEITSESQQPNPKLLVANVSGFIGALCLAFNDLVDAKLTRRRTLGRYLDAKNFPGGNPESDAEEEFSPDIWYVEQKSSANNVQVEFVLASPIGLNKKELPGRQILSNCCQWLSIGGYRGPYCGYTGGPVANSDDIITTDAADDACSGTLKGCKFRFGETGQLRYGSFPTAGRRG